MSRLTAAAESFERTLVDLGITGDEEELRDPEDLGRRAALLAAADVLWRKQIGRMYSSKQVRELTRIGTRQGVSDLAKRRRLLALPDADGRVAFPAFQFMPSGRPLPGLPAILATFADAVASAYTIASWFVTPDRLLQGETPAEWLRRGEEPSLAVEAARRYAERLRH
jgi:hypothetical protein